MEMRVSEAAKKLNMNTQTLRLALQQGKFPFGEAVKTSEKRWTYYINPTRLNLYLKGELWWIIVIWNIPTLPRRKERATPATINREVTTVVSVERA